MILQTKIKIDWEAIKRKKRAQAAYNNVRENHTRINHTYQVGDKILIILKACQIKAR